MFWVSIWKGKFPILRKIKKMSKEFFFTLNKHSIPRAIWTSVYFKQLMICVHNALFWSLGIFIDWESNCYVNSLISVDYTAIFLRYVFLNCLLLDVSWHFSRDHFSVNKSWDDKIPAKNSKTRENPKIEKPGAKW